MSRSSNNKPFYVDVGTSIVAIRCASNHDVIVRYDHVRHPHTLKFAEDVCDRMNREVEIHNSGDCARKRMEIEIANLRKENAKLRGALKLAITMSEWCGAETDDPLTCCELNCIYQKEPHGEAGKKCPWKKIRAALATTSSPTKQEDNLWTNKRRSRTSSGK